MSLINNEYYKDKYLKYKMRYLKQRIENFNNIYNNYDLFNKININYSEEKKQFIVKPVNDFKLTKDEQANILILLTPLNEYILSLFTEKDKYQNTIFYYSELEEQYPGDKALLEQKYQLLYKNATEKNDDIISTNISNYDQQIKVLTSRFDDKINKINETMNAKLNSSMLGSKCQELIKSNDILKNELDTLNNNKIIEIKKINQEKDSILTKLHKNKADEQNKIKSAYSSEFNIKTENIKKEQQILMETREHFSSIETRISTYKKNIVDNFINDKKRDATALFKKLTDAPLIVSYRDKTTIMGNKKHDRYSLGLNILLGISDNHSIIYFNNTLPPSDVDENDGIEAQLLINNTDSTQTKYLLFNNKLTLFDKDIKKIDNDINDPSINVIQSIFIYLIADKNNDKLKCNNYQYIKENFPLILLINDLIYILSQIQVNDITTDNSYRSFLKILNLFKINANIKAENNKIFCTFLRKYFDDLDNQSIGSDRKKIKNYCFYILSIVISIFNIVFPQIYTINKAVIGKNYIIIYDNFNNFITSNKEPINEFKHQYDTKINSLLVDLLKNNKSFYTDKNQYIDDILVENITFNIQK
jgi:hypothetical protein